MVSFLGKTNLLKGVKLKNLKTKLLTANSRNMVGMAIKNNTKTTKIYLHAISQAGENQWYESIGNFKNSTALTYYYAGEYKVVFAQGMKKSTVTDWI